MPITDLSGYEEGKKISLRISGNNLEWRFDTSTEYKIVCSIDALIGVETKISEDGEVLFKCKDETEWKNLMRNGQKVTISNLETTPATIGPTAGGI